MLHNFEMYFNKKLNRGTSFVGFVIFAVDIKAYIFYMSHDIFFPLVVWLTKTLNPSMLASVPLANFSTHLAPPAKKLDHF